MEIKTLKGISRLQNAGPGNRENGESSVEDVMTIVTFANHSRPFILTESACEDPRCQCYEIKLQFAEVVETREELANPVVFEISLALDTWREVNTPVRSGAIQQLVDEFKENLTEDLKNRFRKHYDDTKSAGPRQSGFRISVEEIKGGKRVSYSEAFDGAGDVLVDGGYAAFFFKNKGKSYIVEDFYCIDPDCNCEEAYFVCFEYNKKRAKMLKLFTGKLSFEHGLKILGNPPGCTKKAARNIYRAWKQATPGLIDLLKGRYKEIKTVGRDLLDQAGEFRGAGQSGG